MSKNTTVQGAYQYPAGHLGNLSSEQQSSFRKFKQICADRGTYNESSGSNGTPSHSDVTLLRVLRARKFELEAAYEQLKGIEEWRKVNRLDKLYEEDIDMQEYEETRRLYPQWTGRRDRRGLPVYLFDVAPLDPKVISSYEKATTLKGIESNDRPSTPNILRLVSLYENLVRCITPWCSAMSDRPHAPTPITQGNNIIDISGVGIKQFWDLKRHIQDSSALATARYPETLDRIFIIGAPSFFPTVWAWIKNLFDPVVVSKIFILSPTEILSTLSQHVDPINIPKKYGGELDFKFGDMPKLDPQLSQSISWEDGVDQTTLPIGPVLWRENENGDMILLAVGKEDGKVRERILGTLHSKYRDVFYPSTESGEPHA